MACGEGYGSDVLARRAASVVGVDANPEAHEHARLRYRRPNLRFARDLVETLRTSRPTRSCSCRRSSTSRIPARCSSTSARSSSPAGRVYVSTPNVLTLAPRGAARSDNPWHVHEYRARGVRAALPRALRHGGDVRPLPRPQAAPARARPAGGLGRVHPRARFDSRARSTTASRPAIAGSDFVAARRAARRDLDARWTSSPCAGRERRRPRAGRARDRPAHPHALRRGLRHVAVRRGVAVGGDRVLLPAPARAARPRGPADPVADARAVRPARGAGPRRALGRVRGGGQRG